MKNLSALLGAALLAFPVASFAQDPSFIDVDLAKMLKDQQVNQYDDSCYGCPIKISFPAGTAKKPLYRIQLKGSTPEVGCEIIGATETKGISSILLRALVDTDSGDTCDVHVTRPDGKKAVLSIEETGT